MSTIIKLPAARDQQASESGNFITRAEIPNLSDITHGIFPQDNKKRFQLKKGIVIYLRDRIGEWVNSNIIEAPFNPIRIYEFYGISLWMQLIASGIKSSFMGRITDSRGHERRKDLIEPQNSNCSVSAYGRTQMHPQLFALFYSLNNCSVNKKKMRIEKKKKGEHAMTIRDNPPKI